MKTTSLITTAKIPSKAAIVAALRSFVGQRAGLQYCNYGDPRAYRAEQRGITSDRHHAETLLRSVEMTGDITAENILEACKRAFCGRLSIEAKEDKDGHVWAGVSYCTGQYFPTEYRKAACAVCASALWSWMRGHCMPEADGEDSHGSPTYGGLSAGEWLRRRFKEQYGRTIAARWFN